MIAEFLIYAGPDEKIENPGRFNVVSEIDRTSEFLKSFRGKSFYLFQALEMRGLGCA